MLGMFCMVGPGRASPDVLQGGQESLFLRKVFSWEAMGGNTSQSHTEINSEPFVSNALALNF